MVQEETEDKSMGESREEEVERPLVEATSGEDTSGEESDDQ